MLNNLLIFLGAFSLSFASVFVLRPIAQNLGLVDRPCSRKRHQGNIPLVGGLAIYTSIIICSFLLTPFDTHYKIYLLSTSFMVLMGALDDYHDIDAKLRLIAQFLIGSLMVFGAGLYINDLGSLFGNGGFALGFWGPLFTVFAMVTCINAFNMTDGVDGLVGVLSLNTFASIGLLAVFSNLSIDLGITSMFAGAIVAFLFFNVGAFKQGRYKIFMGDAGSMLMGLTVMWLLTYSTRGEEAIMRPITAIWLIAIPLMDMFSVMLRRILAGQSPLKASRDHIHHIFLANGFSTLKTTLSIVVISLLLCAVGVISDLFAVPEPMMAVLFVLLFGAYNYTMIEQDKKFRTHQ